METTLFGPAWGGRSLLNSKQVQVSNNPFADPARVARYENWYQTTGRRADRLEKALLRRLLVNFKSAHTILEVGCGTGHFTRWFNELGLYAVGLDVSPPMLV